MIAALLALCAAAAAEPVPTTPAEALACASAAMEALDYQRAMACAKVAADSQKLDREQAKRAYLMLGSAMCVLGDPLGAELPFRLLFSLECGFDVPERTPPKILAVFRKVQVEERKRCEALAKEQRRQVVSSIELLDAPPSEAQGGQPLKLQLRLRDPRSAIDGARFWYRHGGQATWSALPLELSPTGTWVASIRPEETANESGSRLEYHLETYDKAGPLLTVGSAQQPQVIALKPGTVERFDRRVLPRWPFFTALAATVVSGGFWLALGVSAQGAYGRVQAFTMGPGGERELLVANSQQLATATDAAIISTCALAVVTVAIAVLTDFRGSGP